MKIRHVGTGLVIIGTICLSSYGLAYDFDLSSCQSKKFRVTSYYSAESDQEYFFQESYEAEIRLNGKGTHGASGAPVFNGMVAAPSSYAFGTQIYFPGRGVGVVQDRGGAIVEAGEREEKYDRIDIRAGKGEEALQRALSFGVQYLDGYVCEKNTLPHEGGFDYSVFPTYEDFFEKTFWIMSLAPGRSDPWVAILQRYLVRLGYLSEEHITGTYARYTKAAVCVYQQKKLGIAADSERCGYFGPQTRATLAKHMAALPKEVEKEQVVAAPVATSPPLVATTTTVSNKNDAALNTHLFTDGEFAEYEFSRPLTKGTISKDVRVLQRKLSRLGYYDLGREITGVYDDATLEAVYAFQRANGLLQSANDRSVKGYLGPKTRSKITRCAHLCVLENGTAQKTIVLAGEVAVQ